MGIKEFRERLSEVAHGTEPVDITHHGRVIGTFKPRRRDPEKIQRAVEAIGRWQEEMKARGIDLEGELAAMGISPDGVPVERAENPASVGRR